SRLTDLAAPEVILMDDVSAAVLDNLPAGQEFTFVHETPAQVQGLGEVSPVEVHRRGDTPECPRHAAHRPVRQTTVLRRVSRTDARPPRCGAHRNSLSERHGGDRGISMTL